MEVDTAATIGVEPERESVLEHGHRGRTGVVCVFRASAAYIQGHCGRNDYRACTRAGVHCKSFEFVGSVTGAVPGGSGRRFRYV